MAPPAPETAPYAPKALARSEGLSWKVMLRIDKAAGAMRAANAPWSARAPNNMPWFTARPPKADAAANPIRPTPNIRLRPP